MVIIGIYLLVNLALLYVLPLPQLAASPFPAADAAQTIFGAQSNQVLTALVLLSLLSVMNAGFMQTPTHHVRDEPRSAVLIKSLCGQP